MAEPPTAEAAPPPLAASTPRALLGAALGAALGVGAWALLASAAAFWTGFLALAVGALAGAGSRILRGRGTPAAAGAALVAALAVFAGLGFAARPGFEAEQRSRLAALTRDRFDGLAAAAADWDPRLKGNEVAQFAYRHDFVDFRSLGGVEARVAEFRRTTVPVLEAWKRNPPTFEEWHAERSAGILRDASPWRAYLSSPLDYVSPLDLLLWILGAAAAARVAWVRAPPALVRRRPPAHSGGGSP